MRGWLELTNLDWKRMRWLINKYGFYWPRMEKDCVNYAKGCEAKRLGTRKTPLLIVLPLLPSPTRTEKPTDHEHQRALLKAYPRSGHPSNLHL